jgi:lipopolysaccharide/colanic/teichoic acid biosynthesis glycosyltransferase
MGRERSGVEYEFLGAVESRDDERAAFTRTPPVVGTLATLPSIIPDLEPNEAVIADPTLDADRWFELRELFARERVRLLVPSRRYSYGPRESVRLIEVEPSMFTARERFLKRCLDWTIALLIGVVGVPLWLLIAGAIRISSGPSVLARETKVGYTGRTFEMLRFRTTSNDGEEFRVTRIGRLIQRFALDEIPALVNVARGEMAIVGPRPLTPAQYENLRVSRHRQLVPPGMTGLCRIATLTDVDRRMQLDLEYADSWSLWDDLAIIFKSVWVVLKDRPRNDQLDARTG